MIELYADNIYTATTLELYKDIYVFTDLFCHNYNFGVQV